jgi:hypothetical protein
VMQSQFMWRIFVRVRSRCIAILVRTLLGVISDVAIVFIRVCLFFRETLVVCAVGLYCFRVSISILFFCVRVRSRCIVIIVRSLLGVTGAVDIVFIRVRLFFRESLVVRAVGLYCF